MDTTASPFSITCEIQCQMSRSIRGLLDQRRGAFPIPNLCERPAYAVRFAPALTYPRHEFGVSTRLFCAKERLRPSEDLVIAEAPGPQTVADLLREQMRSLHAGPIQLGVVDAGVVRIFRYQILICSS